MTGIAPPGLPQIIAVLCSPPLPAKRPIRATPIVVTPAVALWLTQHKPNGNSGLFRR